MGASYLLFLHEIIVKIVIINNYPVEYTPGQLFTGSRNRSPIVGVPEPPAVGRGHINTWTKAVGHGSVLAFNPLTGDKVWQWETYDVQNSGILTTAADLLFVGGREGSERFGL